MEALEEISPRENPEEQEEKVAAKTSPKVDLERGEEDEVVEDASLIKDP